MYSTDDPSENNFTDSLFGNVVMHSDEIARVVSTRVADGFDGYG